MGHCAEGREGREGRGGEGGKGVEGPTWTGKQLPGRGARRLALTWPVLCWCDVTTLPV